MGLEQKLLKRKEGDMVLITPPKSPKYTGVLGQRIGFIFENNASEKYIRLSHLKISPARMNAVWAFELLLEKSIKIPYSNIGDIKQLRY